MNSTYKFVKDFKKRYPLTLCWWRTKKHAKLVDKNLLEGEEVLYAFAAQKDYGAYNILNTAVLAITNKRMIVAQDRLILGYCVDSVAPELYNDMQVNAYIIWGKVTIDTLKETIYFSYIQKSALNEIQNIVNDYMSKAKRRNRNVQQEKSNN